jgi:hypothetical protein
MSKQNMNPKKILFAIVGALMVLTVQAQDHLSFDHSPTLAPADETSAGGGTADEERAKEAELAKKLQNEHGWTYGALVNQIWSYAGWGNSQVNATFLQPFISRTTKTYTTFGLNTESTYDWSHHQWSVPLNLTVAQLLKIGKQPVQFQIGGRYYAQGPSGGPDWGLRFTVTFLFPK